MNREFKHIDLKLVEPSYGSKLTGLVMELTHLRKKRLSGSTPPHIFFQIKKIFHIIESISSARIEGNRTTIIEYIDSKIDPSVAKDENIKEVKNMEESLNFIEKNVDKIHINKIFLSEIHKKVVKDLTVEGSRNPGEYRSCNPNITGSKLVLPDYTQVSSYMDELFNFINKSDPSQFDLLKTAIAHHRFVWIHPFDNGNGRTVRLLTYAMLAEQGFRVHHWERIINPAAVFCMDRDKYYAKLARADKGDNEGMIEWCEYVLKGLRDEVEKIDRLTMYEYVKDKILFPAIKFSLERKLITDVEAKILKLAVKKVYGFKNADLQKIFTTRNPSDISRLIRNLKKKNMLMPKKKRAREYIISFNNNYLLRGIMNALDEEGFLPLKDEIQ